MGLFSKVKSFFSKPKQTGTVFLKPSESVKVPKGVTVSVPSTGQKTVSTGKTVTATPSRSSGGGSSGGSSSGSPSPSGTIFLKPDEKGAVEGLSKKTGAKIEVPETGETFQPSARKIEQQISSSVDLPKSSTQQALDIGKGVQKPSPKFDIDFIRKDVAAPFFFVGGTPLTSFRNVGSLFQSRTKIGDVPFQEPQFGTVQTEVSIQDDVPVLKDMAFKKTTGFEKLREEALSDPSLLIPSEVRGQQIAGEISKELTSELQTKVTSGELTLEEAEKQFKEQFKERAKGREKDLETSLRFQERVRGAELPSFEGGTIGELAGIDSLSLSPVGTAILGTAFVASGLPKITGGETLLERGIGIAEVGFGLVGGGLAVKQAERLADVSLIRELQAERGLISGREVARIEGGQFFQEVKGGTIGVPGEKGVEGSVFNIKSTRAFGEDKLVTELTTPIFRTGKDTFSITGGRGTTKLDFFSISKGERIEVVEKFGFGGRQFTSKEIPSLISRDLNIGLEEFTGVTGKGFVQREGVETFEEFGFGGVSKEVQTDLGKLTQVQSGSLERLRLERITRLGRGGTLFEEAKGVFKIQETGIIKRLKLPSTEDIGGLDFIAGKGSKTPFTTTFQETITPPISLSAQIEKTLIKAPKIIKTTSPKTSLGFGLPRIVGGTGLTEQQLEQELETPISDIGLTKTRDVSGLDFGRIGRLDFSIGRGIGKIKVKSKQRKIVSGLDLQIPASGLRQDQIIRQGQLIEQELIQDFTTPPPPIIPETLTPFKPRGDFGFRVPLALPKFLGGGGDKKVKKKRARAKVPTRPSFTGIVLEIEEAAIVDPRFGVSPFDIRGLETGLDVPKKKKKKKKKK